MYDSLKIILICVMTDGHVMFSNISDDLNEILDYD